MNSTLKVAGVAQNRHQATGPTWAELAVHRRAERPLQPRTRSAQRRRYRELPHRRDRRHVGLPRRTRHRGRGLQRSEHHSRSRMYRRKCQAGASLDWESQAGGCGSEPDGSCCLPGWQPS